MRDERGAGTLLVIGALSLLMFVATGALAVARILVIHTQVSAAADLAALAAARAGDCAQAERIAEANRATLRSCVEDEGDFQVVTAVELSVFGQTVPVTAAARAGY